MKEHEVRDRAVTDWNAIIEGSAQGPEADRIRDVIWRWDDHHLITLRWLIPQIVEDVLSRVQRHDG